MDTLAREDPGRTAASGTAPRLHERAFAILAARIADGSLTPGTRLLESHVSERFGISRAPARRALARLEADGLVARSDGRGYVVRAPSGPRTAAAAPDPDDPRDAIRLEPAASWERIYKEVEGAIVARTALAAWRVVETKLAERYGVSRTVAREVLARLQQRGVIKKDEQGRWLAPALTPDYVAELYELRWVLEPAALTNAAARLPAGLVADVRANLQAALAAADRLDGPALDALEADLHVRLLGHCGNRALMEALALYQSLLVTHSFLYGCAPRLYPVEPFLAEHLAVVERLGAGHVGDAARALEEHLRLSLDRAINRIEVVSRGIAPQPLAYLQPVTG